MNDTFITERRCGNKRGTFLPLSAGPGFTGLNGLQVNLKYWRVYVTAFTE